MVLRQPPPMIEQFDSLTRMKELSKLKAQENAYIAFVQHRASDEISQLTNIPKPAVSIYGDDLTKFAGKIDRYLADAEMGDHDTTNRITALRDAINVTNPQADNPTLEAAHASQRAFLDDPKHLYVTTYLKEGIKKAGQLLETEGNRENTRRNFIESSRPQLLANDAGAAFDYTLELLRHEKEIVKLEIDITKANLAELKEASQLFPIEHGEPTPMMLYHAVTPTLTPYITPPDGKDKTLPQDAFLHLAIDAAYLKSPNVSFLPTDFIKGSFGDNPPDTSISMSHNVGSRSISVAVKDAAEAKKVLRSYIPQSLEICQAFNGEMLGNGELDYDNIVENMALTTMPENKLTEPFILRHIGHHYTLNTLTIIPVDWAKEHSQELIDWAKRPEIQKKFNPNGDLELIPGISQEAILAGWAAKQAIEEGNKAPPPEEKQQQDQPLPRLAVPDRKR